MFALAALLVIAQANAIFGKPPTDGAEHTQFLGGVGLLNPCNNEGVSVTGPVKIVYHEVEPGGGDEEYSLHLTFSGDGVGNQGNQYRMSFIANEQFSAPTEDFGSFQTFVMPFRANFVSRGGAPNFELEGSIKVFVVNGKAVGAFITAFSGSTCHG